MITLYRYHCVWTASHESRLPLPRAAGNISTQLNYSCHGHSAAATASVEKTILYEQHRFAPINTKRSELWNFPSSWVHICSALSQTKTSSEHPSNESTTIYVEHRKTRKSLKLNGPTIQSVDFQKPFHPHQQFRSS